MSKDMINLLRKLTVTIFALALPVLQLSAKNELDVQYGFYAGGMLLSQDADFTKLPGVQSCCYSFDSGAGTGFELGALYYSPISTSLAWQAKLGFSYYMSDFNKTEVIGNAYDYNYNTIDALSEFQLDVSMLILKLNPSLVFRPFTNPFYVNAGLEAGFILTSGYEHTETLLSPSIAKFIDGSRTRSSEGSVEDMMFPFLAVKAGLGYDLPLSSSLLMSPEAGIGFNLNNIVKNYSWRIHALPYLSVSFRFVEPEPESAPPQTPPPPVEPPPPLPPELPGLDAEVKAYYLTKDMKESDLELVQIQEFLTRKIHPLLNNIFFSENSSDIATRYNRIAKSETVEFSDEKFFNRNTLDVYHDILNIIGHRLRKNPKADITIVGCNSDENLEKGNTALSARRAETVKKYLVDVWDINPKRIKTETRNLPKQPSNMEDKDGVEENRRVELYSNSNDVFEPMTIRDTTVETTPPVLKFKITSNTKAAIREWTVRTYQQDKELKSFTGKGAFPSVLDWDMAKEKEYLPLFNQAIYYKISILDEYSRTWESTPKKLEVEALTAKNKYLAIEKGLNYKDKEVDVFSLMSFAFNSADLNREHRAILTLAKEKITDSSRIQIKGYTDRVGDELHNRQLSMDRAMSTAAALNIDQKYVSGLGESEPLFDNNLPEGRFYNRTVYITIENPVKK